MFRPTFKTVGFLVAIAATCGIAQASDGRPQALPQSVLTAYGKAPADGHFRDALARMQRPDIHHWAYDDWRDKDRHGGHPCTPE